MFPSSPPSLSEVNKNLLLSGCVSQAGAGLLSPGHALPPATSQCLSAGALPAGVARKCPPAPQVSDHRSLPGRLPRAGHLPSPPGPLWDPGVWAPCWVTKGRCPPCPLRHSTRAVQEAACPPALSSMGATTLRVLAQHWPPLAQGDRLGWGRQGDGTAQAFPCKVRRRHLGTWRLPLERRAGQR